jgi:hypothetical protein
MLGLKGARTRDASTPRELQQQSAPEHAARCDAGWDEKGRNRTTPAPQPPHNAQARLNTPQKVQLLRVPISRTISSIDQP